MQTKIALFLEKHMLVMGRGTFKGTLCAILEKHLESNSSGWLKMKYDHLIENEEGKVGRRDSLKPGPSFAILRRCAARDASANRPAV